VLCLSLDTRVRGYDVGCELGCEGWGRILRMGGCGRLPSLPRQTLVIPAPSHRHSGESRNPEGRGGEGDGVLCLSLDTRVRGYDVGQRGYDGIRAV